jgi:hypothetical protein
MTACLRRNLLCWCALAGCLEPVDLGFNVRDAGAAVGMTPCTVGRDETCNELPSMSALAGACSATGCVCLGGFERGPTGLCRPQNSCPASAPQPGQACTLAGLTCAYGDQPPACGGQTVRCEGSTWVEVDHPDPQQPCTACRAEDRPTCVAGTPQGPCGDGAVQAQCVSWAWVCPPGTIPPMQCACVGLRPGCTCTPSGWSCSCVPGSVRFEPTEVRFGEHPVGCRASRPVVLWNTCAGAQTVSLSVTGSGAFAVDAGVLQLAPDASVTVPVEFRPQQAGLRAGALVGTTSFGLVTIPTDGTGIDERVDTFTQSSQTRVDVLVVLSDGPGMTPVQAGLAASGPAYLQYAATNALDLRLGVLRGRADGGGLVDGSPGAPPVLTTGTPNAAQRWQEKFLLGDAWTPTSSCLVRAAQHLAQDAGWLRADATLSLVCVQNTLEQPSGSPRGQLAALQGAPNADVVVSAIANFTPGCAAPDDAALTAAVSATDGERSSVCTGDGGLSSGLGLARVGLRRTWRLSAPASGDGGFTVSFDGQVVPGAVGDAGVWRYDASRNAIVFPPLLAPEPGRSFTVRYRPACGP